jgi:hypothetical protein
MSWLHGEGKGSRESADGYVSSRSGMDASVARQERGVNHHAWCRTPATAIRLTYLRTVVKEVVTLLVKSQRSISSVMGVRVTRDMASVSLAFKCPNYAGFSVHC